MMTLVAAGLIAPGLASPAFAQNAEPIDVFAADAPPAEDTTSTEKIEVGAMGQISIEAADVDIQTVLRGLAMQAGRNIIISRDVSGEVTFTIRDADFYKALDAILVSNGFRYVEKGSFIHVMTQADYDKIEEANRKMETRIMRLNYLTAKNAAEFMQPMLSEKGKITASADPAAGVRPGDNDAGDNSYAGDGTLIIHDYSENLEQIQRTLEELDIQPRMVQVEATILQADLNENNAFGVDFAIFADIDGLSLTNPLNIVEDLIDGDVAPGEQSGAAQSTVGNVGAGPGGLKVGVVGQDAALFVRALNSITNAVVVSSPKLTVLNRQRADILVGQQLGYLSTTATDTSTTQTVEFLDVGTQLTVRPFVSDDGFIRLELKPSISDGATREVEGFVIPDTTIAEMTTNVILKSGQSVVLGGLFKEDTTITKNQIPGLGDIPFFGNAFRGQDDTVRRSEVIFLVKATVLEPSKAYQQARDARAGIYSLNEAVQDKLLPWSREKLAGSHLRSSLEYLAASEAADDEKTAARLKAKAMWSADAALQLDPLSAKAMQIKHSITGERMLYPEKGILNNVIDETLDAEMEQLGLKPIEIEPTEEVAEAPATQPLEFSAADTESNGSDLLDATIADMDAQAFDEPAVAEVDDDYSMETTPEPTAKVEGGFDAEAFAAGGMQTTEQTEEVETDEPVTATAPPFSIDALSYGEESDDMTEMTTEQPAEVEEPAVAEMDVTTMEPLPELGMTEDELAQMDLTVAELDDIEATFNLLQVVKEVSGATSEIAASAQATIAALDDIEATDTELTEVETK